MPSTRAQKAKTGQQHRRVAQRRHSTPGSDWDTWEPMETVRALVALMANSTWEMKASLLHEAFALQGLLVEVLRYIGLGEDEGQVDNGAPSDDHQGLKAAWIRQQNRV
ncbi:C2H2 type zinc finger domain-containing protein, partial [Metarhizium hybridum]